MDWTHRLRIRQLHILVALHHTGNMSHTAARLNMTQPALSKWLAELEADLGVSLFERHAKGLVPTRYSDMLIAHANTILAEIDRTRHDLELMVAGATGHLALGATPGVAASDVAALSIAAMRAQFPQAFVTLSEGVLQDMVQLLHEGKLDYVIGRMDARVSCESLAYDPLYDESVRVIASREHPLAIQPEVTWADTRSYGWVGMPQGSQLRRELDFELAVAFEPPGKVCVETSAVLPTLAIVRHSDLLGLASSRVATYFEAQGFISVLALPYASKSGVGLLRRREYKATPIGALFRDSVLATAAQRRREETENENGSGADAASR